MTPEVVRNLDFWLEMMLCPQFAGDDLTSFVRHFNRALEAL